MPAWLRYTLLQIPGIAIVSGILLLLSHFAGLSREVAVAILIAWLIKDVVMYPVVRRGYAASGNTRSDLPQPGAKARVVRRLAPEGYVRLGPELWLAALHSEEDTAEEGELVRVLRRDGIRLVVERTTEGTAGPAGSQADR